MKTKSAPKEASRHRGGRPRKFKESSHPITITLPDRVLKIVDAIGPDRARALARAVDHWHGVTPAPTDLVTVIEVAKGVGILVVAPSVALRKVKGLRLVEVAPARYLLTLLDGFSPPELEISVADILADGSLADEREHCLFAQLHEHLRRLRQSAQISRAEILFVTL